MKMFSSFLFCAALFPLISFADSTGSDKAHALSSFQGELLKPTQVNKQRYQWPQDARTDSRGVVVTFLSAKCPCSNSHVKELKSLKDTYPEFDFVAVHSNPDEAPELTQAYFADINLPFPVIQDQKTALADQFGAFKTPHTFVVLKSGEIAYQGGVSSSKDFDRATEKFLREALEDLHQKREVKKKEGRTLGCVISRGETHVWR